MFKKFIYAGFMTTATVPPLILIGEEATPSLQKEYHAYNPLIQHYEFNNYPKFDGITCAVIVLNALRTNSDEPTTLGYHSIITQENIFNSKVLAITNPENVEKNGVAIEELAMIFQAYGLKTQTQYPHIMTKEALKEIILTTVHDPNTMMVVQYDQSQIELKNQVTYCVVAGYDQATDSVLLLNVDPSSKHKTWIHVEDLLKCMKSLDENHTPRGMILVQKPQE
jgi:hypothetical protein